MNIAAPNPIKLVKSFSDVKADMTRMDGNLTQWQHHGRTYPGSQVDDSFRSMARDLDDATLSFSDLHPQEESLLNNLKEDTLDLAYNAGMTRSMNNSSTAFGSGWSSTMDPGIRDTDQAINVLTEDGEKGEDVPPTPLKVLQDLSDVQADLTRWDANFTQWQNNGRTYPNREVSRQVLDVARDLYDARNDFRELYPEQSALLADMQGDIINVAGDAGSTRHMYTRSSTFGSGWRESLDRPIQSVRRAIDLIVENQGADGDT